MHDFLLSKWQSNSDTGYYSLQTAIMFLNLSGGDGMGVVYGTTYEREIKVMASTGMARIFLCIQ